jgi:hypothetical protein
MKGALDRVGRKAVEGLESALNERRRTPEQKIRNVLKDRTVLPGMLGFSRLGYRNRKRSWAPVTDSLEGKCVVITGATSDLGRAAW